MKSTMINNILNLTERIKRIIGELRAAAIVKNTPVNNIFVSDGEYKKNNVLPNVKDSGVPFKNGDFWGGKVDAHYWFYTEVTVGDEIEKGEVRFELDTRLIDDWEKSYPQFLVYVDGKLQQGIDSNHKYVVLSEKKTYKIHIYAYTGMYFDKKINLFVNLLAVNKAAERLAYNLSVPFEVLSFTPDNVGDYKNILLYLNNTVNLLDWRSVGSREFWLSVNAANEYIENEFYKKYCGNKADNNYFVDCIGHTHIDVAWLWTMRQTVEKAQRSFSTALALMEEYPDYKFTSSQPFLYEACKTQAPEVYEKIKERVKAGQWEAEGAMWVEADCNLTSGESLVRQILYGKKFFKEEFGVESEILWLPDVFGYSVALPQILKKTGVKYFVTSKISWNDTNTMPNDTFMWRGLDGSEIFTYFLTAQDMKTDRSYNRYATYNAKGNALQVAGTWNAYRNKELSDEAIITYGYGDGGGGSTKEDIENIRRMEYGIPGCPKTRFSFAKDALGRIEKQAKESGRIQKWVGELYFEYHRGTLTTQAHNKRNNRKAEFAMQNLELLYSLCGDKLTYPKEEIDELWKIILNNQFHDVVPGSGIKNIYEDSDRDYAYVFSKIEKLENVCKAELSKKYNANGEKYVVFNPNGFTADGIIDTESGKRYIKGSAAKGISAVDLQPLNGSIKTAKRKLEDDFYEIIFDKEYNIVSLFDKKHGRQIIKEGEKANELRVYEDLPLDYDGWELRDYYIEKSYCVNEVVSAETFSDGATGGIKIVKKYGDSTITQIVRLYENIGRIDFETEVDWNTKHSLLKALFPLDLNADFATFDVQFGNITRPTHQNTSWDRAKFESCGHKYADISESDYGVAILNDCKYGYSVINNVIGLSLLRGATYPNPDSDMGKHNFTYSLFAHEGAARNGEAERQAFMLNNPLQTFGKASGDFKAFSFVACSDEKINIGAVKRAENGEGYIVRLNETNNARHKVTLEFSETIKAAYLCDLLENNQAQLQVKKNKIELNVKPFEIITIRVERE